MLNRRLLQVAKEDITVRFFEEIEGATVWEGFGEFQQASVHKQVAISFRTPRYRTVDIDRPVKVSITQISRLPTMLIPVCPQCLVQLRRPSDGVTSEPLPFEYYPLDSGRLITWTDASTGAKLSGSTLEFLNHVQTLSVPSGPQNQLQQQQQQQDAANQTTASVPVNGGAPVAAELQQKSDVPTEAVQDECVTSQVLVDSVEQVDDEIPVKEEVTEPTAKQADTVATTDDIIETVESAVTPAAKVSAWVDATEFTEAATEQQQPNGNGSDEERTLNALLDQVAELDDIYEDHQLRCNSGANDTAVADELNGLESSIQSTKDDSADFDDAATYTSLQIAFKHPISILNPLPVPVPVPAKSVAVDNQSALVNPPGPLIAVHRRNAQPPVAAASDGEKLPPLPPKRGKKLQLSVEDLHVLEPAQALAPRGHVQETYIGSTTTLTNATDGSGSAAVSRRGSARSLQRPQSQIIIMKSPSQPPTKKLPPAPTANGGSCSTLPRSGKKPGFFSKLFSRRKSKSDLAAGSDALVSASVSTSQLDARSHSRAASVRSVALKPPATVDFANASGRRTGKPCGRSVSSVSGKRPHLTADIVHIPLKGCDSSDPLPRAGREMGGSLAGRDRDTFERASTATLSNHLDRKTVSALQLADLPLQDGGMELIAIADRQSLKNLCESEFGVVLDPSVDLTEAEHYALYTSVAPHATASEFDEASAYYAPVEAGEILTQDEVARRLASVLP